MSGILPASTASVRHPPPERGSNLIQASSVSGLRRDTKSNASGSPRETGDDQQIEVSLAIHASTRRVAWCLAPPGSTHACMRASCGSGAAASEVLTSVAWSLRFSFALFADSHAQIQEDDPACLLLRE